MSKDYNQVKNVHNSAVLDGIQPMILKRDPESVNDPRLAESLNGKQQGRLYGFFTAIPKTCESAAKAPTKNEGRTARVTIRSER
jgi:hypothetical protein